VGDTVGDPFKDTSSVAMNPIIKFTTLFGLLAVELAVSITAEQGAALTTGLSVGFLAVALFFVYRSFYGMRIGKESVVQAETVLGPPVEIVNGSGGRSLYVWKDPASRAIPRAASLLIITLTVDAAGIVTHTAYEER
jgi:hypothetical protein